MANVDVSQGSQGFGTGIVSDLGGTARGCIMGGSQMGFRFPSPLSMPCVVLFPDQALHPIGVGDNGLVLIEHLHFYLLMQEVQHRAKEEQVIHSSAVETLFSVRD